MVTEPSGNYLLNWRQFGAVQAISPLLLENAHLAQYMDYVLGNLVYQLKVMVLSDTFANDRYEKTLSVPATSWQMFKSEHASTWWMRWLVKKKPVKNKTHAAVVEVERMHLYPEARVKHETYGPVRIYENTRDYWKREK